MPVTDVLRAALFSDKFPQIPTPEENAIQEQVSCNIFSAIHQTRENT
jgi:hypothetical protein